MGDEQNHRQKGVGKGLEKYLKKYALAAILVLYAILAISYVGSSPHVWGDEGAYAEAAWALAEEGVVAQKMWTGFLGYGEFSTHPNYMYFFFLAAIFKVAGLGIMQARAISIIAGAITLILTYFVTKKLYGTQTGALATALVACNPLFILFARTARPEMLLTMFIVAATASVIAAKKNSSYVLAAGFFASCAAMTHINGVFAALGFFIYILTTKKWKKIAAFITGATSLAIPYMIFLVYHWETFTEQFFGLFTYRVPFSLQAIMQNMLAEPSRWLVGKTVPLAMFPLIVILVIFARQWIVEWWKKKAPQNVIIIPLSVILLYFVFIDQSKYYGYLLLIIPYLTIIVTVAIRNWIYPRRKATETPKTKQKRERRKTVALVFLAVLIIVQFSAAVYKIAQDKDNDYEQYCQDIKEIVGADKTDNKEIILADPALYFCFPEGNLRGASILIRMHAATQEEYADIIKEMEISYVILDKQTQDFLSQGNRAFPSAAEYINAIEHECDKEKEIQDTSRREHTKVTIYACT